MNYNQQNKTILINEPLNKYKKPLKYLEFELKIRGYSNQTIKSYIYHNNKFLKFVNKSPLKVRQSNIKEYIIFLINKGNDKNTINLSINSIMFYYRDILKRRFNIKLLKKDKKLMPVLSRQEVHLIINSARNKHKLVLQLLYYTGLRVSELINLQFEHIDLSRNLGYVKKGKGNKDRSFPLHNVLKKYFSKNTNKKRYILSTISGKYSIRSIQCICKKYAKKAGVKKTVTPHTLRRSFATHLIESGVDIYIVQRLLGHSNSNTTLRYIGKANIFSNKEIINNI